MFIHPSIFLRMEDTCVDDVATSLVPRKRKRAGGEVEGEGEGEGDRPIARSPRRGNA